MQIFVARHPIFDRGEQIVGYELAYREAASAGDVGGGEVERTAEQVAADAFLGIGLDRVTDGRTAFFRVTESMLLGGGLELLDPKRVVLELPAEAGESAELVEVCERMHARGYRFSLDGDAPLEALEPLLGPAQIARLDVERHSEQELEVKAELLRQHSLELLARNVENTGERDRCLELGFTYFHGYAFSLPEVLIERDLSIDHLRTFQLMRKVRDLETTDAAVEEAFRSDLALSYKLLRVVNSAAIGGAGVDSIGHAIRLLGREALHRWLTLLLLTSVAESEVEAEIVHAGLARARLCELLAAPVGMPSARGPLFIVGLLSVLDLLLGTPMENVVDALALDEDVSHALLERDGPYGPVLRVVEGYDKGDWETVIEASEALGIAAEGLSERYLEALSWANERALAGTDGR